MSSRLRAVSRHSSELAEVQTSDGRAYQRGLVVWLDRARTRALRQERLLPSGVGDPPPLELIAQTTAWVIATDRQTGMTD